MIESERILNARGIRTVETNERVAAIEPDLVTRFRGRAERRRRKLNAQRLFPSYRWEIEHTPNGRWAVVAMQNRAMATRDAPPRDPGRWGE